MRLDKLAITAQEAFQNAMSVAGDAESAVIQPIHLLKALLDSDENNLSAIIKRIGADPVWLAQNVTDEIAKMPKQSGSTPMPIPSQDLIKVIDGSVKIAEKLGDSFATSEHLLIALSEDKTAAGRILTTAGITRKNIEDAYDALRGDTRVTSQTDKTQFEALEQYGENLTQKAREGKLDPVIGRSDRDSPYRAGAVPPHEEQPGAHRRARHRQNCHRRGPGPAHCGGRCAFFAEVIARLSRWIWGP